jgi:hypothetical protein
MSDKCTQCLKWQKKKDDRRFEDWKTLQNCKINHVGSANSMETTGALRIFKRSLDTRGLKYKSMLGDGDSSTYNIMVENKPYGDECVPNKMECIGHVQKRVGSRFRKLRNQSQGVKLKWLVKV